MTGLPRRVDTDARFRDGRLHATRRYGSMSDGEGAKTPVPELQTRGRKTAARLKEMNGVVGWRSPKRQAKSGVRRAGSETVPVIAQESLRIPAVVIGAIPRFSILLICMGVSFREIFREGFENEATLFLKSNEGHTRKQANARVYTHDLIS